MASHSYTVTVTPSTIMHSSAGAHGQYETRVIASCSAEARKIARRAYRDEEGRYAPKAHFSAAREA